MLPMDLRRITLSQRENADTLAFFGSYNPLSNFHACPVTINNNQFNCMEQFIQFTKAKLFSDDLCANKILETESHRTQKDLGKKVRGFVRDSWEARAENLIFPGLLEKFLQNQEPCKYLMNTTSKTLVEATYDNFWGSGLPLNDTDCLNNEKGKNLQGRMLMKVREQLHSSQLTPSQQPPARKRCILRSSVSVTSSSMGSDCSEYYRLCFLC